MAGKKGKKRASPTDEENISKKRERLEILEQERTELIKQLGEIQSTSRQENQIIIEDSTENSTHRQLNKNPQSSREENLIENSILKNSVDETLTKIFKGMVGKYPDLPIFSGDSSEWNYFENNYTKSTEDFDIPQHENAKRLKKALKGDAEELVSKYLDKPGYLPFIIQELKDEFGREEIDGDRILNKCEKIPYLQHRFKNLREFSIEAQNINLTIKKLKDDSIGYRATQIMQKKLCDLANIDWGRAKRNIEKEIKERDSNGNNIIPAGQFMFEGFVTWLKDFREMYNNGGGKDKEFKKNREEDRYQESKTQGERDWRYTSRSKQDYSRPDSKYKSSDSRKDEKNIDTQKNLLSERIVEKVLTTNIRREDICGLGCEIKHKLLECSKFKEMSYQEQVKYVYDDKRCYKCTGLHWSRNCMEGNLSKK